MESTSVSGGREERRKRLMERGTDRMALITGQIRTLPETSSLPSLSSSTTHDDALRAPESSTSLVSPHGAPESSTFMVSSQNDHPPIHAGSEEANVASASGSESLEPKISNEISESIKFNNENQVKQQLSESVAEADTNMILVPSEDDITKTQTSRTKPSVQKASYQTDFFSSKRINACIIASEQTRVIVSLIIACLVLISQLDYPLLGIDIVNSESMIAARPIYMILLTDVTIVITRMFRDAEAVSKEPEERTMATKEDGENWTGAVKLLERGLVAYQAIRGIFIDCSIYLVVVICGLSLM